MIINEDRKLATVQRIKDLQPIENADKIEVATVLGWQCVVKKGEFKVGDLCIYFEIDSILPDMPYFEFMRERKFKVKTIKLRGQISQGLALRINDVLDNTKIYKEGQNVTNIIGVTKYDPQKEAEDKELKEYMEKLAPKSKVLKLLRNILGVKLFRFIFRLAPIRSKFPTNIISKTDEERIQNCPQLLGQILEEDYYITEKLDGSSATYILYKGKFIVCSRNFALPKDNSIYWKIAKKYDIENKLRIIKRNFNIEVAIQGEIIGAGIQENKYKLDCLDFYVFNLFDINKHRYLDCADFISLCSLMELKTVPFLNIKLNDSLNDLIQLSNDKSIINLDTLREGIVIRNKKMSKCKISFKVINPEFLLKYGL